jgi:uncharacterized protein (DUF1800 family)
MASLTEFNQELGFERASHLLKRSTFGHTNEQALQFQTLTPSQAIDLLFADETLPAPPIDPATGLSWVRPPDQYKAGNGNSEQENLVSYFKAWHLDVMRQSGLNIKEKLTWFLHTHLPVSTEVVDASEPLYYQNTLFRHYAYGSFKTLFKKICLDNAMLRYIDGYSNRKDSPNENFAREMLELYSIGKGPQIEEGNYTNYTEDDIKAATRVLTGWTLDDDFQNLDPDCGIPIGIIRKTDSSLPDKFLATDHDGGEKTFSGVFGNAVISPFEKLNGFPTTDAAYKELDDMIETIFAQHETARFIIRKLYRYFVYHVINDEIEKDIVVPLAQNLYNNNYVIIEPLKTLFKSQHFYDADNSETTDNIRGALIKSPIDLMVGLMKFFGIPFPDREASPQAFYNDMEYLVERLHDQGLDYYRPFDVAGYDAYFQEPGFNRNWITSYALAYRYQAGDILMKRIGQTEDKEFYLDIVDWAANSGAVQDPSSAEQVLTALINGLFAVKLNTERYNYFLNTVFLDGFMPTTWQNEWNNYQISNDDSAVRERLETLLSALIQTPEFQLM